MDEQDWSSFDQFEENRRLHNTKTTYDFNQYTTKIDESKLTREQKTKAEKLADQIEKE